MTILTDKDQTARKNHKCIWCGDPINKGELYHLNTVICDLDEFCSGKYHLDCWKAGCSDPYLMEDGFEVYSFARGSLLEKQYQDEPDTRTV